MGLLYRSLAMQLVLTWVFWSPELKAQISTSDPRALDVLLQDYAYRAFVRPKTGVIYDGMVPENLSGIRVSALRLRSGSLRKRGFNKYKEFAIPKGIIEQPYVERLVLVYQNLGNWSEEYYAFPGYRLLTPVLGLLAYDAANLSAKNLPELDLRTTGQPISISFPDVELVPSSKCVWFDSHGMVNFSEVISDNTCSAYQQGHFSIVVESTAPSPSPAAETPPSEPPPPSEAGKKTSKKVWIIVGSVVGGSLLLILLGLLVLWLRKYKQTKKMQEMEKAAEVGEALHMTTVGNTKAPVATVTRTQPTLENEYVP